MKNTIRNNIGRSLAGAAAALLALSALPAHAQSDDALINKLVKKGILTEDEAADLRKESDKDFSKSFSAKTGMADWVNSMKFYGDVRLRYEELDSRAQVFDNGQSTTPAGTPGLRDFPGRTRFRYRLRFGTTVTMMDNLEAGMRLISGDVPGTTGGKPLSGNSTFQDNASKKSIYIDLVYGRWYFPKNSLFSGNITAGKMENPFALSDMVFDPDYTPEGAALQFALNIADNQKLKLNGGVFVLDENQSPWTSGGGIGDNPFLGGVQLLYEASWTRKLNTSLGISWLGIQNATNLTTAAVPDLNVGNTRDATRAALKYNYEPIVLNGAITYTLDNFPLYRGAFPVKINGEFMNNSDAPYHSDNYAWNAGLVFGKAGKRGTWEFSYAYKYLGANAWYEELVDDDFGAVYQHPSPDYGPLVGRLSGYYTGTNVKGHIFRFAYSPADALTLSAKFFLTELIRAYPLQTPSEAHRFQVDATLKF